jgi:hypothetical protein
MTAPHSDSENVHGAFTKPLTSMGISPARAGTASGHKTVAASATTGKYRFIRVSSVRARASIWLLPVVSRFPASASWAVFNHTPEPLSLGRFFAFRVVNTHRGKKLREKFERIGSNCFRPVFLE